jgi:glycosyltransferase involved in cell wall biosynthesis
MKIIHVTEAWNGGISTYVNTLMAQQARRHDVCLVYSPTQSTHDFQATDYANLGIKTYPYNSSRHPLKIVTVARELHTILNNLQGDIIHLHSTFPGVYGRLFTTPTPRVYCAHGWSFVQEKGSLKKSIYVHIEKTMAGRCDAIINISRHEENAASQHKIFSKLDITVPSGVNMPKMTSFIPALDLDSSAINLGFIGRLDYKKGFDILARAINNLKRKDIHLYVLGAASRDGMAGNMNLSPHIHLCGWVDHAHIDSYIRLFDAVVVPSRHEGFGLVALEAMRNARACIVSQAGGLPELIDHGHNGYIFKNEEDLKKTIESLEKSTLRLMGANAHSRYQKLYTAARFADDIEDVYNKVLYARKTSS